MICYLDRDGIINYDDGYVGTISRFRLVQEIIPMLISLKKIGYRFVIVTNQSGLSRGYFTLNQFYELSFYILDIMHAYSIPIEIRYCRHMPTHNCKCRKPNVGMLDIDLRSPNDLIIGDKHTDMLTGYNAKVEHLWLVTEDYNEYRNCKSLNVEWFNSIDDLNRSGIIQSISIDK